MKKIILIGLLSTSFAWANQQSGVDRSDLQTLIAQCKAYENNPQIKAFKSEITCSGSVTAWELDEVQQISLANSYSVSNEVEMKGNRYNLPSYRGSFVAASDAAECNQYKEMRYAINPVTVVVSSCAALEELANEGRDAYCFKELQSAPKAKAGVATGRILNTCDGKAKASVGQSKSDDSVSQSKGDSVSQSKKDSVSQSKPARKSWWR